MHAGMKLLAIDDNPDNLLTLRALLAAFLPEATLSCCLSAREGLERAASEQPDTILLDVQMPEMDGLEMTRRLKADPALCHIPVILVTAYGSDPDCRALGLSCGADAFLGKPLEEAELVAQIKAMLRIKRSEDALRRERDRLEMLVAERTSELLRANEELEKSVAQAEAANLAKNEFLANMSHEIRTPINGIMGSAEVLRLSSLDEEQSEFLGYIRTSAKTLLLIINNVLDLSKVEAGMVELECMPFSLRQCLGEVVSMQILPINSKGLSVQTRIADEVRDNLLGDQLRLKQILLNLLGNAVKFTQQGEITISVAQLSADQGETVLRFSVRDTGIGMKKEVLAKIFAPFVQADASTARKYGGTGLGLAISSNFVQLMNGRIWAESLEGVSSTFHVEVPFLSGACYGGCSSPAGEPGGEWDGPLLHVVVAEDNEIDLRLTRWMLRDICHSIDSAANGEEAVACCRQAGVDAILMNVRMPILDGVEACRLISEEARQQGRRLPIIALTAYALNEDREWFLSLGFDGYVSKPISSSSMKEEILRCLNA